jgi:hypothetical protein
MYGKMEYRVCPRCGRDYTSDPYWTSKLRRHLARKNPCDRPPDVKYIREPKVIHEIATLDSLEWDLKKPPKGTSNRDIVPWLFRDIFSKKSNICFVKPNKSKNEIVVRVSKNSVQMVTIDGFIKLFVNHVFLKKMVNSICENNCMFERWLNQNLIAVGTSWNGIYPDRSSYINSFGNRVTNKPEFIMYMRTAVKHFCNLQEDRMHLKNILLHI